MRAFVLVLASLALAVTSSAQRRQGNYRPAEGKPVSWQIDANHELIWGGARYVPVGLCTDGSPAALDAAKAAGVQDVLIDVPLARDDWNATVSQAEKHGLKYLIRLSSLAPSAEGVEVDPGAYRVDGVKGSTHLDLVLPTAKEALVVVALKRGGSLLNATRVPVENGRLVFDTKVNQELENVVLVYPVARQVPLVDFWEGLDTQRDVLLGKLRRTKFGPGLRGLVDPFGSGASLPVQSLRAVPTSNGFQQEFASLIETKYRTVKNVMEAWSMSGSTLSAIDVTKNPTSNTMMGTFADLAKLIPLWSGTRGISYLWQPGTSRLYACDKAKSAIWRDIEVVVAQAANSRAHHLTAAIRQIVDVPVVQEWQGWAGLTEDPESAFDGIGARAVGQSPGDIVEEASRTASTVARWSTNGWLLATDISISKASMSDSVDDLNALGMRSVFLNARPEDVAPLAKRAVDSPPVASALNALFFPENAANPAAVQRISLGTWWLPTPQDGNRIDYGTAFSGYRMVTPKGQRTVLWARQPGRYLIRLARPSQAQITTMDGHDLQAKNMKNGVQVDLNQTPIVVDGTDEIPVPDFAVSETMSEFQRLLTSPQRNRGIATDEAFAFNQAAEALEANPGGSYLAMRAQLRRLAATMMSVIWIEAERTADTTFSETAPVVGASGGQALVVRSAIDTATGFAATYEISTPQRGDLDLWVAARIPESARSSLQASLGGQTMLPTEKPVSRYGDGFAWFRLGTTRLALQGTKLQIKVSSSLGVEIAIDAIVFAPVGWKPNGLEFPYSIVR